MRIMLGATHAQMCGTNKTRDVMCSTFLFAISLVFGAGLADFACLCSMPMFEQMHVQSSSECFVWYTVKVA